MNNYRLSVAGIVSILVLLFCSGVAAQSSPKDSMYRTLKNIEYRASEPQTAYMKQRCRLDLYYPSNSSGYSTVVWFHAGGLTAGEREIPSQLRERGICVVAAGYRLSPNVKSPAYIEDAAAAVAWTFRNIGNFGGSKKRIFVSGHSAGGYLTSMIGLNPKYLATHKIDANDIAGLIPFSGHTITHFTVRKERGIAGEQPVVDAMAPLFHIRADAPPLLLITGDRELEMLGRYEENAYFWRMMRVAGHTNTDILELDGYDHGGMVDAAYPLLIKFIRRIEKDVQ